MEKMTAVQWLIEYCEREKWPMPSHVIDIAIEMEKEQIMDAHLMGGDGEIEAEKYYKEKYEQGK